MGGLLKFIAELSASPVAGLLAAGVLARLGLRGRRVDDHPLCRGCGYDLFGTAGARDRCPECGRDVRPRSAIVVGHRERRRGMLQAALVVALASGVGMVIVGRVIARGLGDAAMRPTWWLIHQLEGRPGAEQHEAINELTRRNDRGELTPTQIRGVVDGVLAWQGDALAGWNYAWGDLVEVARAKRLISEDQWSRYLRQGVVLRLRTRPVVRQGDDPQFEMILANNRFSARPDLTLNYDVAFQLDGTSGPDFHRRAYRFNWGSTVRFGGPLTVPATRPAPAATTTALPATTTSPVALGRHVVRADIDFEIVEGRTLRPPGAPPAPRWRQTLRSRFDVVPADRQTVDLVRDPDVLATVAQNIKLRELVFRSDPPRSLDVSLDIVRLFPVDFAVDVIIRAGGREWVATGVAFNAGTAGGATAIAIPDGFDATRADVIVRGTVAAAARTIDMTRVWGGEVIFKDVPVTPSDERGVPKPPISPTTRPQ